MNVARRTVSLIGWSILIAAPCIAQSNGGFIPTGNMTAPRSHHTATRLHDGKILIAGCSGTNSAELYDPASHSFGVTGGMTAVRCGHSATLLADGRVLIAGGDQSGRHSAEIYDPSSGAFTPTGDMIGLQLANTGTLLPNGRVLIAGGFATYPPAQVDNPELFDPSTGTFSLTGAFAGNGNLYAFGGPYVSAAVALSDGRVLIAGEPISELYDPRTGTFQLTGVMTTPCWGESKPGYISGRTATVLTNGLVLLTGGEHEDCGRFANAELYDVATGTFTATGSMTRPRDNHSATLLRDGTVLIAGGESVDCNAQLCFFSGTQASAELFDPLRGTFTALANMSARRAGHSATSLDDGTVLVAGGYLYEGIGQGSCCFFSAELFVGASGTGGQVASPDGTTVPAATQIVDNTGAVWTIAASSAILRNGVQAAGGYGRQILWKSSTIYVLDSNGGWWQWTGSGWVDLGTTAPGGGGGVGGGGSVSSDGTTVPTTASQIVDNAGAVWTIAASSAILRNGVQAAGGYGQQILWKSSTIYVRDSNGGWWRWTGSGWMDIGTTTPGGTGGGSVSPDGTIVPTTASQIVDNTGAVWTIASSSAILRNGVHAAGGYGRQILWKSSTIYVLDSNGNWWQWAGSGWIDVGTTHP